MLDLLPKRRIFVILPPRNWSFWCQLILELVISKYNKSPVVSLLS